MTGFSARYRVRFDEAGPDGRLRTSGLLRYTQDLAGLHSESLGYDRGWYAAQGLSWIVRTAEIHVLGAIPYGSELTATTRVTGFRRVWSRRQTTFELGDATVAVVRIDWVLLDRRGAPTRIPPAFEHIFEVTGTGEPLVLGRVTPGPTPAGAIQASLEVRPHELDPLDHVNNAVYADWLDEAVGSAAGSAAGTVVRAIPRRVRLEYALAAGPGETLDSLCWPEDDGWLCRIVRGTDGTELLRARLEAGPAAHRP